MANKGDVKAVQITTAAQVFGGRTRLRGIILSANSTTVVGSVTLHFHSRGSTNSGGKVLYKVTRFYIVF